MTRSSDNTVRVGSGDFIYEVFDDWGELPKGWELLDVGDIAVDSQDRVYVLNRGGHPVIVFDQAGQFIKSWGEGEFTRPHGICIGPDDAIYTADDLDHTVREFSPEGQLLMTLGTKGVPSDTGCLDRDYRTIKRGGPPFHMPTGVALSPNGELYVSDGYGNARVHKFSSDGELLISWGEPGTGPGEFNLPHNISISQDGRVYVADRQNSRVQVFTLEGKFITQWTDVSRPCGLKIDTEQYVYVAEVGMRYGIMKGMLSPTADSQWSRVSVFDLEGNLLARWGEPDVSQAGNFVAAHAICIDGRGDVYVGEVLNAATKGDPPAGSSVLHKFIRVR
ncbi:MAG: peptidyl-alpha-hydroxyglycine alpha-amidating lyase family protein [Anaerolineales bacterium]|jgi:DNA-binding beta-propeller fold protein YncE